MECLRHSEWGVFRISEERVALFAPPPSIAAATAVYCHYDGNKNERYVYAQYNGEDVGPFGGDRHFGPTMYHVLFDFIVYYDRIMINFDPRADDIEVMEGEGSRRS